MIGENIKHFRKEKGISQEELAVRLNVVRQTVSKWENGRSVPDADVLVQIAKMLEVSVGELLGTEADNVAAIDLSEELSKANEQLAKNRQRENLMLQANKKRGLIIAISFLAMLVALQIQNEAASILLAGGCMFAATIILYRNLALLTSVTTDDLRMGVLRVVTVFDMGVLLIGIAAAVLIAFDGITFTENGEKMFAMTLVSCVMLFAGIIAPKLPYSKHTGLRLPWTVQDEDTWNIAHRIVGYISFPIVLLYIACTWTISNFELVTLCAMILWVGIPGIISCVFFYRKMYGRLKG